jgi:CheY-like chemotaxis protein
MGTSPAHFTSREIQGEDQKFAWAGFMPGKTNESGLFEACKHSYVKKFALFAEDDLTQRQIWDFVCKKEGLSHSDFTIVSDGAEAISFLERSLVANGAARKPDIIFTDLRMPEVDGIGLLKWIKASPAFKHIPVVILTASYDKETEQEAKKIGCSAFLPKPVGLVELRSMLRSALKIASLAETVN